MWCALRHADEVGADFLFVLWPHLQVTGGGRLRETPPYATASCFKRCNCGDGVPTDSTAFVPLQVARENTAKPVLCTASLVHPTNDNETPSNVEVFSQHRNENVFSGVFACSV